MNLDYYDVLSDLLVQDARRLGLRDDVWTLSQPIYHMAVL